MIILVAIRIGEGSRPAVNAAAKLASALGAELRLLYVSEEMEAVEELARAAGQSAAEVRQRMLDEIHERCYIEIGKPFPLGAQLMVRQGDVAERLVLQMGRLEREELRVVILNTKNAVLRVATVYQGNVASSLVRVGELSAMPSG